ncbi:MAG: hypothetical protein JW990_06620 [Thermoleophilia bacterium]|nr:hypothetical protein [Thermoleophilia bacterium]
MTEERIFTDQELAEMGTPTLDLVLEAIDAGDKERAKALAVRMQGEYQHLHDGYFFWVTGLQSYIYRHLGVDAVEEAEREAHTAEAKVVFTPPEKTDLRSLVEHMASGLRGHMQPITIVETDKTISLSMKPCGSGERLIQMGGYSPEVGLAKVEEPHRITWGMEDFPMYCVHCPVMEAMAIENTGNLGAVHVVTGQLSHGACEFVFFKDKKDIPDEFYTRIGKQKP